MTLLDKIKQAAPRQINDSEAIFILKLLNFLSVNHINISGGFLKNSVFEVSIEELERIKRQI